MAIALLTAPASRYGWLGERFVWLYMATLWLGGGKVWISTFRPIAESGDRDLVLRPPHMLNARTLAWDAIRGTEQSIGGDRLIVWYDTPRGPRFVALNLNLVKGRREFLALVDTRLRARGFEEQLVERSRWMSPIAKSD